MSHAHSQHSLTCRSLGRLQVSRLFTTEDLHLCKHAKLWDVLEAFLRVGEAQAERLLQTPQSVLILQSVPGKPNTGAIYLYDRERKTFFWLRFDKMDDGLSGPQFDLLVQEYQLLQLAHRPSQVAHFASKAVAA
jgi:hypothetical protein